MDYLSAKSELEQRPPQIAWKAVAVELAVLGSALAVMLQL